MKKLNITKETYDKSKYFQDKYGKLEYVSESGKIYKTSKGNVLKFKESKDMVNEDAVDEDLKLLDQYCSGIKGNLNDAIDPDGLSIKNRIANFIGWKDSKSKGKFVKESSDLLPAEPKMKISELISRLQEIMDKEGDMDIEFMVGGDRYTDEYTLVAGKNKIVGCSYFHEEPSW